MTHHAHGLPGTDHSPHQHAGSHDQHRVLDLDAEVFGENLAAVLDLAGVPAVQRIVDLGAGTGAGSRLLRERYPDATITCVDNDPQMLTRLRTQGFAVVEADLDDGFPALAETAVDADATAGAPVDLVWASSSLHHVAHPARLLAGVRRALAPGGTLVVVELATLPGFLSTSPARQLEQRCQAAAAAEGWNQHPDWTPALESAGFTVTRSEVTSSAPASSAARDYAQQWFARFQHLTTLDAEDRGAVADLLARIPGDLELAPRTTRTAWIATGGTSR